MAKDTSDMLGALIVRAVLSQERIKDRPHLLTSALAGGWKLLAKGTDDVKHDFQIGQAICVQGSWHEHYGHKRIINERTANFLKLLLRSGAGLAREGEHSCEIGRCELFERLRRLVHRHKPR